MKISINELISPLPDGKKREILGALFVDGVVQYYNYSQSLDDYSIDSLIEQEFSKLLDQDDFLKNLKDFSEENLLKIIPNGTLKKSIIKEKIRNYFELKIETEIQLTTYKKKRAVSKIKLHDFQERIRRKVINLIFAKQKRFLVHMPTGAGKTRTAAEIILDFIRFSSSQALFNEKTKILWIAQSKELCIQAYETISFILENKSSVDIELAHFYDDETIDENILDKQAIIFCSIQKLLLHYQSKFWSKIKNDNYLIIVDEAHRSVAAQWQRALDYFVSNSGVYLLGLTATPGYGKTFDSSTILSTYYHNNKISITDKNYTEISNPIQYLVKERFLAHINRIDIDSTVSIKDAFTGSINSELKFKSSTLKELSINPQRNSSIINIVRENVDQHKKILVFTCGKDHNKILTTISTSIGISAKSVDESTKNRSAIIEDFKNGDLQVLFNFGVLTTGFDAPNTDVCIIARPIGSIVMYSQMVGRILRGPENQGNETNTLYTIKDNLGHGDYDDLFNYFNDFYI